MPLTLHVLDLRNPPGEDHPKPAIPAHFIDRVAASLRDGESALDEHWKLRIEQRFRAPTPGAPPGAAVGFYPDHARVKPPVIGGVRFSVSATHLPDGGPCQIGWLAWNDKLADEVWRDAINAIDQNAVPLGSLCPFEEPERPRCLPWLAVLRLRPWLNLSPEEQADLSRLRAWIGWAIRLV